MLELCWPFKTLLPNLLFQFVGEGVGHHGLPSARRTVEQHHHPGTVCDGIIKTHPLTTSLVHLKVTHSTQNELFLVLA